MTEQNAAVRPPSKPEHGQRYTDEAGTVWEYEQAAMGDSWPGHWIVVSLTARDAMIGG